MTEIEQLPKSATAARPRGQKCGGYAVRRATVAVPGGRVATAPGFPGVLMGNSTKGRFGV
ncbi:hypothetical protein [Streptomyces odonnellii]|uniref:hypothetical protein n=1 Tax=Streptomyces odonnellii TaxID=1417980 RepID=UPI000625F77F|nr:hypothetical protein [Streptomyces odonnellii]